MRAPAFWWRQDPSPLASLLRPAGALYGRLAARRLAAPGERAPVPVVCVGNFTVGGAGKTPAALALAGLLAAAGHRPSFLTRGYGGRLAGPVRVDPTGHTAADVGDEPLLLARAAPTVVSRYRPAGARLAIQEGASVVVMDDGLQNPSLAKDLSLAVIDAAVGVGNGLCLPAGPLRAPLEAQWPRVDALLVVGGDTPGAALARLADARALPVLKARLVPDPAAAEALRGRRVLAFAGIGRPEKFFASLRACGAEVVEARPFPDHHPFGEADIRALLAEAEARGLTPVTTEKDLVRLRTVLGSVDAARLETLPVRLAFDDEGAMRELLRARLRSPA